MTEDFFLRDRASYPADPLVCAFFWHRREDGWEKALFNGPKQCGCCGEIIRVGWIEMESDAIRCHDCVPTENPFEAVRQE